MKKWIISLSIILILCGIRFANPWFLDMARLKALDQHQRNQTTQSLSNLVTVEINNETIKKKGQWPWDRNTLSVEIIKLYQQGASLVVLPILFADKDRFGKDSVLARTLSKTPTIIGKLYPSISMEILRMAAGDISYQMKTGIAGVEKLRIPKFKMIDTDANGNIWLDFKWKTTTHALHEKLPDLSGKIVIVSMTASGLDTVVSTPVGAIYGHDLIGASLATMMTGRNISRPWWADIAELSASFILSVILSVVVITLAWYYGAILMPIH